MIWHNFSPGRKTFFWWFWFSSNLIRAGVAVKGPLVLLYFRNFYNILNIPGLAKKSNSFRACFERYDFIYCKFYSPPPPFVLIFLPFFTRTSLCKASLMKRTMGWFWFFFHFADSCENHRRFVRKKAANAHLVKPVNFLLDIQIVCHWKWFSP